MNTYYLGTIPVSDELWHHGILGQKWGIRRYQNPDGSLTAEGKARYGTDIERSAAKDAQRMSDANAAYGSGSVIRKRLVSREIEQKRKIAEYDKAYEEAAKHVDKNKSFKRAEKLKKHEGTFNRGWELSERGKTAGKIILDNYKNVGMTALTTGGTYILTKKRYGAKIVPNLILAVGGISALSTTAKSVSDIHSLNYYNRNRKF